MIDIHSHILPNLDDGPETIDEAIKLLQLMQRDGVSKIIATPHVMSGIYNNSSHVIKKQISLLEKEKVKFGIDIEIIQGAEHYISHDLLSRIQNDPNLTINSSRFLLIEFPLQSIPQFAEKVLNSLISSGYIPIIAHPERTAVISYDINYAINLVSRGCLMQVNAGSITGAFGKKVQSFSKELLKQDIVFAIATDAHGIDKRAHLLSDAVKIVCKWINEKKANDLVTTNPLMLLS